MPQLESAEAVVALPTAPMATTAAAEASASATALRTCFMSFLPGLEADRCREAYGLIIVQGETFRVTQVPAYGLLQCLKLQVRMQFGPLMKGAKHMETGGGGGI